MFRKFVLFNSKVHNTNILPTKEELHFKKHIQIYLLEHVSIAS